MSLIFVVIIVALWIYGLNVLSRAKLEFWRYILGALGMFLIGMVVLSDYLIMPLARIVCVRCK